MTREYEKTYVPYHGIEWMLLVELGYFTHSVQHGIAHMWRLK